MRVTQRFKLLTKKAKNVVITTHLYPDADGIGSELALCLALKESKKNVYCVNEEPLPDRYHYLNPGIKIYSYQEFHKHHDDMAIDLFIIVDAHSSERVGTKMQKLMGLSAQHLFIDHHPCQEELQALHCIDTKMAATGQIVGSIIETLKIKFTPAMALPLYAAMIMDTSSFRYPTVTGDTHRLIAKLMDTGGINPQKAYNQVYGTKTIGHMLLLGLVLSSAQTTDDESIAWLSLNEEILKKYKVEAEDTNAYINHLLVLDKIQVACMFRQSGDHVRVSLRSTGKIDVGAMAQAMGGGGHNHSAATTIKGELHQVIEKTIANLKTMLRAHN
ncbi:MAG: bifunctional oligoribonuclease/PAP phosphatase NrnA [Pseudomonadota bacterium]